jgi:hypothetical protein
MPRWIFAVSFAPLLLATDALADDRCPPGSWFCEEVPTPEVEVTVNGSEEVEETATDPDVSPASKHSVTSDVADDELAQTQDEAPKKKKSKKSKKKVKKTVEVEGEGDTVVIVKQKTKKKKVKKHKAQAVDEEVDEVEEEDADGERPRRKKRARRWRETFGLNVRVEGAAFIPQSVYSDAGGLGGLGASFRWRPSPYFAFDVGTDVVGGTDYNGNSRLEIAGSLSGLVYFNPQHRIQVYGIGGVHAAHAGVDREIYFDAGFNGSETYDYVGFQAGLGLEFRLARHFGLFADALAVVRREVNDDNQPEFYNPETGETTDTSGAGLLRAGATFWW